MLEILLGVWEKVKGSKMTEIKKERLELLFACFNSFGGGLFIGGIILSYFKVVEHILIYSILIGLLDTLICCFVFKRSLEMVKPRGKYWIDIPWILSGYILFYLIVL